VRNHRILDAARRPGRGCSDLGASVASLRKRGPDDSGVWVRPGGRVALGHTRLSILDLSPLGHQPMRSADGTLQMVFNGEVYNFAAVRAELESLGHRFRSSGDSEVILAAFQQWGVKAVDKFIGMFAIALWNEQERRMILLRDRMGVKPLYYAWNGNNFWFGSELKALRAFRPGAPRSTRTPWASTCSTATSRRRARSTATCTSCCRPLARAGRGGRARHAPLLVAGAGRGRGRVHRIRRPSSSATSSSC
jgi:asparagine synthase (glutamine-hydrolysing)